MRYGILSRDNVFVRSFLCFVVCRERFVSTFSLRSRHYLAGNVRHSRYQPPYEVMGVYIPKHVLDSVLESDCVRQFACTYAQPVRHIVAGHSSPSHPFLCIVWRRAVALVCLFVCCRMCEVVRLHKCTSSSQNQDQRR
jgi:hypothetical protein